MPPSADRMPGGGEPASAGPAIGEPGIMAVSRSNTILNLPAGHRPTSPPAAVSETPAAVILSGMSGRTIPRTEGRPPRKVEAEPAQGASAR
jgi:hypothetical protein